jgi:glucosamine kinase
MKVKLIADSGSTKCEWCLLKDGKQKKIITKGISPYFLNEAQIVELLKKELLGKIKDSNIDEVYFYGTGLASNENVLILKQALKTLFSQAKIEVTHDLMGAAKALCGKEKGIACILGTGSNSCYFDGKKIVKNSPGLGYVLGDEGSGTQLGKKVLQHFLYDLFDEELKGKFWAKYKTGADEILNNVYKKPLPNRYLAGFVSFLVENRGHYMIDNIIEDSFNDFFFTHIPAYKESATMPLHFTGSVAFGFKDVLQTICFNNGLRLGLVMKNPMKGLIKYHLK